MSQTKKLTLIFTIYLKPGKFKNKMYLTDDSNFKLKCRRRFSTTELAALINTAKTQFDNNRTT